jgi:hypothetical protein
MIVFSQPHFSTLALFYSGRPIFEANSWADVGSFASAAARRIIMDKQDLVSKPADYSIKVEAQAEDFVYGWVRRSGGLSGARSRSSP